MSTSIAEPENETPIENAQGAAPHVERASLNRLVVELRSGRRLEKLISSIESFFLNQFSRLQKSFEHCAQASEQQEVLRRLMAEFDRQRAAWESERQAEIKRLVEAGESLIRGWRQLEQDRQMLANERGPGIAFGKYRSGQSSSS